MHAIDYFTDLESELDMTTYASAGFITRETAVDIQDLVTFPIPTPLKHGDQVPEGTVA